MPKLKNPLLFSEYYGIDPVDLEKRGILDPTLNFDTRLFVDPLLLEHSQHSEIANGARGSYEEHFGRVIRLLRNSKSVSDVPGRNAVRHLSFPEVKWTCLGYGARSISGGGSGSHMTAQYVDTARQIVALGIEDPDLFVAMALFEEGVGPDRIGDMATNVILKNLLEFNERVLAELNVPRAERHLALRNGKRYTAVLARNPCLSRDEPVVLVPSDVLRALPIATDKSEVADAAAKSAFVRAQVNADIAHIWKLRSSKDKHNLRKWALGGKAAFEELMTVLRSVDPVSYDMSADPQGELVWKKLAATVAQYEPRTIASPERMDLVGVQNVVEQIIDQFRFLIEERRLSEELYHEGKPRHERSAQRLFFAVAHAYCKANDLDLTPEADTGNGPVDFKVSRGFSGRVLVEIKLSKNTRLIDGYTKQLETYKKAEETLAGYYVVVDVGSIGDKRRRLLEIQDSEKANGARVLPIYFVSGMRRKSASKK